MICSSCAHDNPDGRKYCRACAKPLTPVMAAAREQTVYAVAAASRVPARTTKPKVNKMAVASLISGFAGLLPPFGLAAVAFGHVSRKQIAKSEGREKGTGIAFAGLILGYGQLLLFAFLFLGFLGLVQDIRQHLAKDPDTRAALLARLAHGDPYSVSPEKTARQTQTAIQALYLIRAKETEYIGAHPDEGYACQMSQVGFDPGGNTELNTLLRESDYDTKFIRCGQVPGITPGTLMYPPMYLIMSFPRSAGNTADAPVFCLDQVNGIEQYTPEQSRDALGTIMTSHWDPCPLTGTHVN